MTEQLGSDHKHVNIGGLEITIRPITPEDKEIEASFVHNLSLQTKYERFFEGIKDLSPSMLTVLCNIDYVNTMAYVATIDSPDGEKEVGVCRYAADKEPGECEMAITVADDYPYEDIAIVLLNALVKHARSNNVKKLFSTDLSTNYRMHRLAEHFGMTAKIHSEDGTLTVYTLLL
jgi:acetyltransferase